MGFKTERKLLLIVVEVAPRVCTVPRSFVELMARVSRVTHQAATVLEDGPVLVVARLLLIPARPSTAAHTDLAVVAHVHAQVVGVAQLVRLPPLRPVQTESKIKLRQTLIVVGTVLLALRLPGFLFHGVLVLALVAWELRLATLPVGIRIPRLLLTPSVMLRTLWHRSRTVIQTLVPSTHGGRVVSGCAVQPVGAEMRLAWWNASRLSEWCR